MRRKDREITDFARIVKIVDECDIIRLGLSDGDFPYIVPLNFSYSVEKNQLYFFVHGAMAGRKYEMLKKNPLCSFEMDIPIKMDLLYEHKDITMRYKCVMGTAEAVFLEGEEKQRAIDEIILNRYEETKNFEYNKNAVKVTAIIKLKVLSLSAKVNSCQDGPDL